MQQVSILLVINLLCAGAGALVMRQHCKGQADQLRERLRKQRWWYDELLEKERAERKELEKKAVLAAVGQFQLGVEVGQRSRAAALEASLKRSARANGAN